MQTGKVLFLKNIPYLSLFFGIFFSVIALDQFLKYKIRHSGGFYLCNHGISFEISISNPILWLIAGIFFIFATTSLVHLYKKGLFSGLFSIGFALLVGGVSSNLTDRIVFGCVLDYITVFKTIFSIFNLADICIFLGTCLILLHLIRKNTSRLCINCQ